MKKSGVPRTQAVSDPQCAPSGANCVSEATRDPQPIQEAPLTTLPGGGHEGPEIHSASAPAWNPYLELRIRAEIFTDFQQLRIATVNRLKNGGVDPEPYAALCNAVEDIEHSLELDLKRTYRAVVDPDIRAWQKATKGVGEKELALLLGFIGHPVHTTVHRWAGEGSDRVLTVVGEIDRSLSQLWSYCGHGDKSRRRRAGMTAEETMALGNPRAKVMVHRIAASIIKAGGELRSVYDEARAKYSSRVAADGDTWAKHKPHGWTPGLLATMQPENKCQHCHNAGLNLVAKDALRGLWLAAGGGGEGGQTRVAIHGSSASLTPASIAM